MIKCKKKIYVKALRKKVNCVWNKGHNCAHTADLTGEVFGKIKVLRMDDNKYYGAICWIVLQEGVERSVRGSSLKRGKNIGKHSFAGVSNTYEYRTVKTHARFVSKADEISHFATYKNMPFYPDWDCRTAEGAYWKGAKWIIENLGERPGPQWTMDIIKHEIGFWPGNLRWALKRTQCENQQHRILGQFSEEEFAVEARRRGYIKKENYDAIGGIEDGRKCA